MWLQVMDRYVEPLVNHLKKMLKYRKFRRGTRSEVDELLRVEKSDHPKKIVYSFGISHEHPGSFILTYIRSENPHHEYVGLYPKGFKFRKRMFDNIDRLVAYFQQHIDDLQHVSTPSVRSISAMVPIRPDFRGKPHPPTQKNKWEKGKKTLSHLSRLALMFKFKTILYFINLYLKLRYYYLWQ